jgi:glutathione-regulated potassium-efflux system ancillary protein KefC
VFTLLLAQGGEFAFVVFQAAAGSQVFTPQTASLLIGAVAVSMLLSPLLLVAWTGCCCPGMPTATRPHWRRSPNTRPRPSSWPGFGRYGQIVARTLLAQGIACTVLDHDAEMIEAARNFGYRVFYGDATRLDLLRTAGAGQARVLVLAVDDVGQSLEIVDLVRAHFPQIEIVARARDVTHWNQLRDRGVMRVQRELFESSLRSARSVLEVLGQSEQEALDITDRFRVHNLALFEELHPHYQDQAKLIAVVKQGRRQLEEQMARERAQKTSGQAPHGG